MAFVRLDRGVHGRALDDDMTFGFEPSGDLLFGVALKFYAESNYSLLVSEQSLDFIPHEGF